MNLPFAMGACRYGRIGHPLHDLKTVLAFLAFILINWQTRYLLFKLRLFKRSLSDDCQ